MTFLAPVAGGEGEQGTAGKERLLPRRTPSPTRKRGFLRTPHTTGKSSRRTVQVRRTAKREVFPPGTSDPAALSGNGRTSGNGRALAPAGGICRFVCGKRFPASGTGRGKADLGGYPACSRQEVRRRIAVAFSVPRPAGRFCASRRFFRADLFAGSIPRSATPV